MNPSEVAAPCSSDRTEAAIRFLESDFQQCFSERQRYETLVWEIAKFTFTAYSGLLAVAAGLYTFSLEQAIDLIPVAALLLAVGLLVGFFMLLLSIRTRVYFVVVTRYVNELRQFFLECRPLGFDNKSTMLTDPTMPPFFSAVSTQFWACLLIATLNSVLGGALAFVLASDHAFQWIAAVAVFGLLGLFQVGVSIGYLKSREGRTSSEAVFGRRK